MAWNHVAEPIVTSAHVNARVVETFVSGLGDAAFLQAVTGGKLLQFGADPAPFFFERSDVGRVFRERLVDGGDPPLDVGPLAFLLLGRKDRNAHDLFPGGLGRELIEDVAAEKDAGEAVVIRRGDGVELVIVAAGAGQGEAEEGAAGDIDLVVHDVGVRLFLVGVAVAPVADRVHAGGDELVGIEGRARLLQQQIAGDLLLDELIVRKVGIEGARDPVAIAPGLGDVALAAEAAGVE